MKKIRKVFLLLFFAIIFSFGSKLNASAASVIAETSIPNIFGETMGQIKIENNGKVTIKYRYGLRRVDMFFCEKGEGCDNGFYNVRIMAEASETKNFKNYDSSTLETFSFNISLDDKEKEYRVRIEAYIGTSEGYSGLEIIPGSSTVQQLVLDTNDKFLKGSSFGVGDQRIDGVLGDIIVVVNHAVLPIIYAVTTLFLFVKGTVLGFQIVKNADFPEIRREKIRGLVWLFIGVGITYAATTIVGIVTGFFTEVFEL